MSDKLHIAVSNEPNAIAVLQLTGPLDANTQSDLESKAEEIINNGAEKILLEMSNVSYIGSAGLKAIHKITNKLSGENENAIKSQNLKVVNPSDEVRRIFKTLGFDSYIDIVDDLDDAISSYTH